MTKRVFVTAKEVPDSTPYIIAGKEYEIIDPVWCDRGREKFWSGEILGEPIDEHDDGIFSMFSIKCPHLEGRPWTVRIEE